MMTAEVIDKSMVYIPDTATWYLAEIIEGFRVEGEPGSTVHVNFVLIRADSPQLAFEKANARGLLELEPYTNSDGRQVSRQFVGLRNLHVIYEPLEDGSEILFERYKEVSDSDVLSMARPKEELNVFRRPRLPDSQSS